MPAMWILNSLNLNKDTKNVITEGKMNEKLLYSKEIFDRAVTDFNPQAIVMMFSGGDDSLTTYHIAKELGIKFDFVIHGNTRTGIEETTAFARKEADRMGDKYLEADAGASYEKYV